MSTRPTPDARPPHPANHDGLAISIVLPPTDGDRRAHCPCKTQARYELVAPGDAWLVIVEDAPFFLSGETWYRMLWTAPEGNPYCTLARNYITARLLILTGASTTPEVDTALAWAESFFNTHTPSAALASSLLDQVICSAGLLDRYNTGFMDSSPF